MMIRTIAIAFLVSTSLAVAPVAHDDHAQGHVFGGNGMEVVHPWARASAAGGDTFVFFELHNEGAADRLLGASSDVAEDVHIVGLTIGADGTSVQDVGEIEVPLGKFAFDPGGLALELHGLTAELVQGQHFELVLEFEVAGPIEISVEVEAADASQHSHAGHSH